MGLKGLTIETAPQAEAHIQAADDRAIWEAIIGMDGVADVGQKLKATLISNNLLRIYDGALVVGGAIARIPFGEYEDITINNGTQSQKRNDLVVAEIDANGATESMKITCIQGTPGAAAVDPDYTAGNVYEGATKRQYPLYRVKLDGLNVEAVETMFEVVPRLEQVKKEVSELNSKLSLYKTGLSPDAVLIESNARATLPVQIPGVGVSDFPGFSKVPDIIIATPYNSSGLSAECAVGSIGLGKFDAYLKNTGGTSSYFKVFWIAIWTNL